MKADFPLIPLWRKQSMKRRIILLLFAAILCLTAAVSGADVVLEPDGLLWNPARNCLVGATTPMAKMMELLQARIGLSLADCLALGRDNPLALLA